MSLPHNRDTRDYLNFADNGDGTTSRLVTVTGGLGTLLAGVSYDHISASYPNSVTEVYSYKTGGSGGATVATVTVVYTSGSKNNVLSVTRV
jgi:hypothetical protein